MISDTWHLVRMDVAFRSVDKIDTLLFELAETSNFNHGLSYEIEAQHRAVAQEEKRRR